MTDLPKCPRCGATLPPDAPGAACPRCLLQAGLDGDRTLDRDAAAAAPAPADLAPHFPDLEILELVGQGGMGLVYKARQRRLDRVVALKILAPDVADKPGFADRFMREARALATLSHPNIVGVHDFGESAGLYYFVMEFVDGANLRQAQRERRLTPEQALAIVPHICDALQYAHDRGVVHRDIKPENILMTRAGEIKIADFGLAKLVRRERDATITLDDKVMGTPSYMAPEQVEQPQSVDHRADIFSLGVVFYEMLTGELPLGRFAPPSRKVRLDVRLDEIVMRTLEKERELRYQQASEVKTGIHSLSTMPRPATTAAPAQRRLSRLALAGAICTGVGILGPAIPLLLPAGMPMSPSNPNLRQLILGSFMIGGMLLALIPPLAGMILSISGWVAISRSQGRLYGLWLAIPGALIPLLSILSVRLFRLSSFVF